MFKRDWRIVAKGLPTWEVRLGNCTRKHAESVFLQLTKDVEQPSDLKLKRVWRGHR